MASELTLVPDGLAFDATIRGLDCSQQVFGRYMLRRILGRGGMGIVWLAYDEQLEREVALKFLPEEVYFDPGAMDELKRETRRCLDLTHPNIIRIYDFVKDQQAAALSMEYVDGQTLAALRVEKEASIFEVDEVRPWIAKVCEALFYAHEEAGVVHRDLKPANLMLTSRGQIKIADFGIAQSMGESMSRMTMRRGTSGTLAYMSPQQLNGETSRVTDDVYAVGTTIYELLTSKPPFYNGDIPFQVRVTMPRTMAERRRELEVSGCDIPAEWEDAIASCLAKIPEERPKSMMDLAQRLGLSGISGITAPAARTSPVADVRETSVVRAAQPPPLPRRRFPIKRVVRVAGVLGLVALVLGPISAYVHGRFFTKPGELRVTSNPPGATVHIPGQPDRITPATFPGLHAGHYQVTLSTENFDPFQQDVTIAAGTKLNLGAVQLQQSVGSLSLATVPLHAHYSLAGTGLTGNFRKEGTTPDFLLKLPSGSYRITLNADGFPPYSGTVQVPVHGTKSEAADLPQLSIAGKASPAPAKVIRGEMPATQLDDKDRIELANLYSNAFEEYLGSGLLASASDELAKLKALGQDTTAQQSRLVEKGTAAENDFSAKISSLIAGGKCATALEKFKTINGTLEKESVDRLRAQFQAQLTPYQQQIDAAITATRNLPPSTAYAQLKALVRQYPDDLDLELAMARVQTQMPPDHEFLATQLAAFQQFSEQNKDFDAEPALLATQAAFADESKELDAVAAALVEAKNGPSKIRHQIANLESRKDVFENRRVGHPKANPFSQTINFFGKAVTGHTVVDNAPYFSSSREKREAISDVQAQIDSARLSLTQPQDTVADAQENYDAFVAHVPWGQESANPPAASPVVAAPTAIGNP